MMKSWLRRTFKRYRFFGLDDVFILTALGMILFVTMFAVPLMAGGAMALSVLLLGVSVMAALVFAFKRVVRCEEREIISSFTEAEDDYFRLYDLAKSAELASNADAARILALTSTLREGIVVKMRELSKEARGLNEYRASERRSRWESQFKVWKSHCAQITRASDELNALHEEQRKHAAVNARLNGMADVKGAAEDVESFVKELALKREYVAQGRRELEGLLNPPAADATEETGLRSVLTGARKLLGARN